MHGNLSGETQVWHTSKCLAWDFTATLHVCFMLVCLHGWIELYSSECLCHSWSNCVLSWDAEEWGIGEAVFWILLWFLEFLIQFLPLYFSVIFFWFCLLLLFFPSFLLFYVFGGVGDSMVVVLIMMYLIVRLFFLYFLLYFFASAKGEERRRKKWVHVKECPQLWACLIRIQACEEAA